MKQATLIGFPQTTDPNVDGLLGIYKGNRCSKERHIGI